MRMGIERSLAYAAMARTVAAETVGSMTADTPLTGDLLTCAAMLRPPYRRSRAAQKRLESKESVRTIVVALVANVVIAIAKLISGLVSGSTALIAEAAHSLADASNEVLLGISLHRASAPPDEDHPLGHGRERFLWAFLAALASFLIGGCFSVAIAVRQLIHGEEMGSPIAA